MGLRSRILAVFGILGLLPLFVTGALGDAVSGHLLEAVATARARANVEWHARTLDSRPDVEHHATRPGNGATREASAAGPTPPPMRTFLVDSDSGRVASLNGGPAVTAIETALALEAAGGGGGPAANERIVAADGGRWVVARAVLADERWVVVGVGSLQQLTGLWSRARKAYLGFVVLAALCTGAALTYLVRPVLRTLEDLTEATNLIGDGELAPWLPARSEGEVGRLSLATGAMVDRVERMMRGVEQGARMAMVGQLATHLAHEIRNPLSSIRLNLQSIARELDEGRIPSDVGEVTDLCLHEIERLDRVASSVLLVGRSPERRPAPGHLHESLRRAAGILTGEMTRRSIVLYLDLLAQRDDVFADRASMQGVFLNLLMNAAESIGSDGAVRVASGTRLDRDGNGWIRVLIEDTGSGVPEQLRDRIFEPFYTTKPDGTGVGLATALETVTAHGGTLTVGARADRSAGASFVIELPLLPSDVPALPPRMGHAEPYPCHRG
jgi:signal transduction histidine kinase